MSTYRSSTVAQRLLGRGGLILAAAAVLILTALVAIFTLVPAGATDVTPSLVAGNPPCSELNGGPILELRVDPPNTGQYSDANLTVNVTSDGVFFD